MIHPATLFPFLIKTRLLVIEIAELIFRSKGQKSKMKKWSHAGVFGANWRSMERSWVASIQLTPVRPPPPASSDHPTKFDCAGTQREVNNSSARPSNSRQHIVPTGDNTYFTFGNPFCVNRNLHSIKFSVIASALINHNHVSVDSETNSAPRTGRRENRHERRYCANVQRSAKKRSERVGAILESPSPEACIYLD